MMTDRDELKEALATLGITQTDIAALIGVTPRGISLWMVGDRGVPGPAMAYVRLLRALPMNLRLVELSRLKHRRNEMRNGMYSIIFGGTIGLLTFEDGVIYGVDEGGVRYDGGYEVQEDGFVLAKVKITYPPYVQAIFGVSNPYEWSIDVTAILDPKKDGGRTVVRSSIGRDFDTQYKFMRSLPKAA